MPIHSPAHQPIGIPSGLPAYMAGQLGACLGEPPDHAASIRINTGAVFFKSSEFSFQFLDSVYKEAACQVLDTVQ
eukprot:scaffold78557_cov24-Tisochrysis_lutea.AAC.1